MANLFEIIGIRVAHDVVTYTRLPLVAFCPDNKIYTSHVDAGIVVVDTTIGNVLVAESNRMILMSAEALSKSEV